MIQKINDGTQNDINPLNAMKRYGLKVTHVMTESSRTVLEVIQQDCTITQKEVVQKLNDMGVIMTQLNVSRIFKKNEITRKRLVQKSEKVISPNVI